MNLVKNKWVGAVLLLVVIAAAVFVGNLATDKYMEKKALGTNTTGT